MFDLGNIRTRAKLDFYQSGGNINEKKKNDTKTMAKNRFNVIRPKNVIPGMTRNDNETTFDFVKCLINDTRTTFCILLSFRSFWMSFRRSDVIPKRPLRTQTTAERQKATGKKWSRLPPGFLLTKGWHNIHLKRQRKIKATHQLQSYIASQDTETTPLQK